MKRFFLISAFLTIFTFLMSTGVFSQSVPAQDSVLISYQGRLTDDVSTPIDGSTNLTFSIYGIIDETSVILWSESHTGVILSEGLFSVILGSQTALPDSVFNGEDRYLGITVGTDPEISPRTLLTSVPSAAYARKVAGDIITDDGMMLINTINGDSAFVFEAGLLPSFRMYHAEPLDKQPMIELNTSSDIGGRLTFFNAEPLDKQPMVELGAGPATGAYFNIYDEIGKVMGVEPSPFNEGYALNFLDPNDGDKQLEIIANHSTNVASIKLIEPGNDGVTPAMEMTSGPMGSYFNINGYVDHISHDAFSVDVNNVDLITNVKMIEPGNDITPGFEFIADGLSDLATFKTLDPGEGGRSLIEMSGGISGGSFKMFNPQPEPPARLFEISASSTDGPTMGFYNSFGALMTAGPNPGGGFLIKMEDEDEEPVQTHVEFGSSFNIGPEKSLATDGGFLSLYSPTDYTETHLYAGGMIMQSDLDAILGPPIYMDVSNTYARIGIGTDSPSEPLVVGTDLGSFSGNRLIVGDNSAGVETGIVVGESNSNWAWMLWNVDNNTLGFGTRQEGDTYGSTIVLDSGRVGINAEVNNEPLSIGADLGRAWGEFVQIGNDESGRYSGFMCGERSDDRGVMLWYNNSNQLRLGSNSGGIDYNATVVIHEDQVAINTTSTVSQELYVSGDIYATGSITEFSDASVKTNVQTLEGALNLVDNLRGVRYNLKPEIAEEHHTTSEKQIGLIAQEVEEVLPEVVGSTAEGYKSLNYSRLMAVLIEAVKELKAENEELKSKIENQSQSDSERIDALERQLERILINFKNNTESIEMTSGAVSN